MLLPGTDHVSCSVAYSSLCIVETSYAFPNPFWYNHWWVHFPLKMFLTQKYFSVFSLFYSHISINDVPVSFYFPHNWQCSLYQDNISFHSPHRLLFVLQIILVDIIFKVDNHYSNCFAGPMLNYSFISA